ncbi:hypothetical protein DFH06DRAFT_1311704 [Mycena polygramma]|nr:hypothetical protein DFH06DRAFT_1311704 [Mycena polygramma]
MADTRQTKENIKYRLQTNPPATKSPNNLPTKPFRQLLCSQRRPAPRATGCFQAQEGASRQGWRDIKGEAKSAEQRDLSLTAWAEVALLASGDFKGIDGANRRSKPISWFIPPILCLKESWKRGWGREREREQVPAGSQSGGNEALQADVAAPHSTVRLEMARTCTSCPCPAIDVVVGFATNRAGARAGGRAIGVVVTESFVTVDPGSRKGRLPESPSRWRKTLRKRCIKILLMGAGWWSGYYPPALTSDWFWKSWVPRGFEPQQCHSYDDYLASVDVPSNQVEPMRRPPFGSLPSAADVISASNHQEV